MKSIQPKEIEEILLHFSNTLQNLTDEEDILWDLVKNCIRILNFEDAVIYLVEGENLVQKAAYGPKNPDEKKLLNPIKIKIGEGVTGKVAASGLPCLVADTRNHPEYIKDDEFRLSEIAVPIFLEGKVIGVIDSENSELGYFAIQHLRILTAVASIYAGHIARIRAERKARLEQEYRMELQKKAYQLQLEAISAQLSPHFVFNSLNAIQHHILLEDKKTSLRFLGVFGKLLRYFLQQLQKEEALLKDEIKMMENYLELQQMRFGKKLQYRIDHSEIQEISKVKIPSIVVQNLIENLLEEQIQHSEGDLSIHVQFEIEEDGVHFTTLVTNSKNNEDHELKKEGHRISPWKDFIGLINAIRPYKIKYKMGTKPCEHSQNQCKYVILLLPNLQDPAK
ncbi:histidine kinase [Algoriphagus hitonicola]|uniref:GAF domain-containing protein n=1 Tax=Algoriphagus hitonicola TaxID=435880 RepID=A0A1I2RE42_9BACT|nr:histidine kinase [Algoriphagus hitonicola]SFG36111.1 GAF domain-containing protein [Algoriphagus hitonicola]